MGGHGAIEVAKTVLEVADVAWTAMEHHHHHHHEHDGTAHTKTETNSYDELESLRSENRRLRTLLEQNLKLLQDLSESPFSLNDCPPDLYARLVATVDSEQFLARLKSLQQASINGTSSEFPFKETSGDDVDSAEILIKVDSEEPSRWVWVTDEMVPNNVEEWSGIDNENYVVVSEEHVVDGVAYFMARCIMSNPKSQNLTPGELQKTVAKALQSTGNQNTNSSSKRIMSRTAMPQKVAGKDESVTCSDAQLKSMYERCDTDKDGRLSQVELQKVLEELGVEFPRLRAKSVLWHADENEDGYISLNEFGTLVKYALTLSTVPKA